jgi:hypothetical protein
MANDRVLRETAPRVEPLHRHHATEFHPQRHPRLEASGLALVRRAIALCGSARLSARRDLDRAFMVMGTCSACRPHSRSPSSYATEVGKTDTPLWGA